jgi:hypothetical protein
MFKNEASFLLEWIEYHRLIGVNHFYLYNNNSSDDYLKVLKPYIKKGIVELFDVPFDSTLYPDSAGTHNLVQITCYQDAIQRASGKNHWLAIIDSDEFICPVNTTSLSECLKEFSYAGGLIVYWQVYGTSNIWDVGPGELMIEKLLFKFPQNYHENKNFKSIVRPETALCKDPHWTTSTKELVIENHSPFSHTPTFSDIPVQKIRINHYFFRTENFYQNVKKKRRQNWGYINTEEGEKERNNLSNSVYDPTMLRFVPQLKQKVIKSQQLDYVPN